MSVLTVASITVFHMRLCKLLLFSASIGSGPLDIELKTKHHYNSLEVDSGFCGDASLQSTSSVGSGGYSSCGIGTYTSSLDSRRSRIIVFTLMLTTVMNS